MVTRTLRSRAGWSMTELMIVVAIVGILATVGSRVMLQINRYFIMTTTRADLQREARALMYVINRSLRQGTTGSITIDRAASQPFYSRLTFTTIQGQTITYSQNGTQLIQTVGGRSRTLTRNLKYLSFTFPRSDDLSVVSVAVTLEKSIYQGRSKALHMASEKVRVMN